MGGNIERERKLARPRQREFFELRAKRRLRIFLQLAMAKHTAEARDRREVARRSKDAEGPRRVSNRRNSLAIKELKELLIFPVLALGRVLWQAVCNN